MGNGSLEKDRLLAVLGGIDAANNENWFRSLEGRKLEEAQFHDVSHTRKVEVGNKKFYSIDSASKDYLHDYIDRHARGKVVLDYACGNGVCAVRAAKAGAALSIGIDISGGSIQNAKRLAAEEGVEGNTFFLRGDCERTGFPDGCIDIVVCSGMLHHIDLGHAFPELQRIMKPGGIAIAAEGLNHNPLIKWYRNRTPELRTRFEKEHILSNKDLRFAARFFEVRNVRYWHLFSIFAVPFRNTIIFRPILSFLSGIDRVVLNIPGVRNMAWQFTFELVKR
ncbi:MAG: class I SAM-dependent methyltransferase [Deltaproteobacteria bacterium]|nr:class I SAM-dependent methyltransferase [Deltaproteobacteria bacterium]